MLAAIHEGICKLAEQEHVAENKASQQISVCEGSNI